MLLNTLTKVSTLKVGKHIVSAKQKIGQEIHLFPLTIALSGLHPLTKVWVDYLPQPKNNF